MKKRQNFIIQFNKFLLAFLNTLRIGNDYSISVISQITFFVRIVKTATHIILNVFSGNYYKRMQFSKLLGMRYALYLSLSIIQSLLYLLSFNINSCFIDEIVALHKFPLGSKG